MSYIHKASQRLMLFTELKGSLSAGSSDFIGGFRMKFMEGFVSGYMNSGGAMFGTYIKSMPQFAMKMELNSKVDFANSKKPCTLGMNLTVGMM